MMKRGFTLIELMVVIVIIGILSAVAIPKLFGMTAKAKVSEVGPAAGTWSKLEQAYIQETGSVGTWDEVGYKAPGSGQNGAIAPDGKTANLTYHHEGAGSWAAYNHMALGDCQKVTTYAAATSWTAGINNAGTVTATNNAATGCGALTPNFTKLQ